ncbi:MAG: hypothetical protein OXC95_08940 [Dehalococcoidia bacterium]|nr:hypothetical protein [Dehalococcoidia bacterium]
MPFLCRKDLLCNASERRTAIRYPDSEHTRWRLSNDDFTAQATAFLIDDTPDTNDCRNAYMITAAGFENAVRSLTAHAVGRMSQSSPIYLTGVDENGRTIAQYKLKKPIAPYYNSTTIEWTRPTPVPIGPSIHEMAAYSRLMEVKYVPPKSEAHKFIATADSDEEITTEFFRWAKLRLPAPMLEEWAPVIYEQGIRQGHITKLLSYGMSGALSEWPPAELRETIRVLGLTGKIKAPRDMTPDIQPYPDQTIQLMAAAD